MIPGTRVAVVGLGLMGGSVARALAARGARILGYDRDLRQLDAAQREGVVHEELDRELTGLATADVIVIALPVDATIETVQRLGALPLAARLVMDVASTKRSTIESAEGAGLGPRYVGAHPLTGSHRSGWGASRASLFEDARVFLCATASTTPATLELATSFWRALRSGVELLDAGDHDAQMAWRSHLPHLLSSALAVTLREAGVRRSALGPGGRDVTRLAGGSASMWNPIVEDNMPAIVAALEAYEGRLRHFREALAKGDREVTRSFLATGNRWFDGEPEAGSGDVS